ncbi:MAG TPA: c-type cytochrome [Gemmatimonadales bacterium]|jgi:thiosulfate dehydrogenase
MIRPFVPSRPGDAVIGWIFLVVLAAACRTTRHPASVTSTSDTTLRAPDGSLPGDDPLGRSIRRGRAIMAATRDSIPAHVGNTLRCFSCHLGVGTESGALPLTGVYARFPQYRSRSARIEVIEDRINECFERSMNGTPLTLDDPSMHDIVAFLAFESRGMAVAPPGTTQLPAVAVADTAAGARLYGIRCARCHAPDGRGNAIYPPLWGMQSFNIGAGMARLSTAAAFIRHNMPRDSAGILTDQEAANVAAYVVSRPRPDFPGKERDWPRGGAPADNPYPTLGGHGSRQ